MQDSRGCTTIRSYKAFTKPRAKVDMIIGQNHPARVTLRELLGPPRTRARALAYAKKAVLENANKESDTFTLRQLLGPPRTRSRALAYAKKAVIKSHVKDASNSNTDMLRQLLGPPRTRARAFAYAKKAVFKDYVKADLEKSVVVAVRTVKEDNPEGLQLGDSLGDSKKSADKALEKPRAKVIMSAVSTSPVELANTCLAQGCPVDSVEEFLSTLKAEKHPSESLLQTIRDLEKALESSKARQSQIEQTVASLARIYVMEAFMDAMDGHSDELAGYQALAAQCLEEGCHTDTVEELVTKLKAEKNPDTQATVEQLEKSLSQDETSRKEMEKLVAAAVANFPVQEP